MQLINLLTVGFSSTTSIAGWLLNIVSNKVVPDLGNPTKKMGAGLSFVDLTTFHFFILVSVKNFILAVI